MIEVRDPVSDPVATHPPITVHTTLTIADIADAWKLYHTAFKDLNAFAVQRHLMYSHEFNDVMTDKRIDKYVARNPAGAMTGLATYTNQLDAWPLISPAYFERRWPMQYAAKAIWYCGFVAVDGAAGDPAAFSGLVEAMYRRAASGNGLIMLDFCRFNDEAHHMGRVIRLMLHRLSGGVRAERVDEQTFWSYEFPVTA